VSASAMPWRAAINVAEIPDQGLHRDLEASESERQAVAAIAGLRELSRLTASFDLAHAGGGNIHVRGRVQGTVEQTCVVTLEPLTTEVDEDVDAMFSPDAGQAPARQDSGDDHDALGEDPPEPIVGGAIDLGHLAVEHLILGLDPYPRKPGVVFEPVIQPVDPADHPFAALAALKTAESSGKPRSKPKGKPTGKSAGKTKGK
jgi:uncharacterized metal-binding protein YceD (DUF177 family)